MGTPRHTRSRPADPSDPAGGALAWRPSLGYLLTALGLAAGGVLAFVLMPSPSSSSPPAVPERTGALPSLPAPVSGSPASASGAVAASPVRTAAATQSAPAPAAEPVEGDADPTPDLSSYVSRGEKPTMAEVIGRLHQAGVKSGLGAFSPPGTRPPLVGLAVPEDFVLPEGYVRHHQATDDGQRIEAILMFAPGRELLDAANRPIEIPKDRVVPPELAPPGLPIRRIVIPAPAEPGGPGR